MNRVFDASVWNANSDHVDQISEAMAQAFGQLSNVVRNKVSHFAKKGKDGKPVPDYADLASCFECIRAAYATNGLSVRQTFHPYGEDGTIYLVTTVRHKSGQFERSYLPMPGRVPPQELAKAATYLKRIALCAITGIAADDDDDGEQAERSHAAAAADSEKRWEKAIASKLGEAKKPDAVAAVLDQIARGSASGHLSEAAATRLRVMANETAAKLQPKPVVEVTKDSNNKKSPQPAAVS